MRGFQRINQAKRTSGRLLTFLITALAIVFYGGASFAAVSFEDGEHVKLGYKSATPLVWEAKALPGAGTGRTFFIGAPLSISGAYGVTNSWPDSNVRAYLNGAFLDANFSPDEISTGVLTPYGDQPIYNVVIPDVTNVVTPAMAIAPDPVKTIPASSAEDALVWILDAQETQAIYNGLPDMAWNDVTGYPARIPYASGGPFLTRSVDPDDLQMIWAVQPDGSFTRELVSSSPSPVRPIVSPDVSVMLYKRGAGTEGNPYTVCYRWDVVPSMTAEAGANTITLSFPAPATNNGAWPGFDAWRITDSYGTVYSVTGTAKTPGTDSGVTLTVFPSIRQGAVLTVKYAQRYDDESQGLNDTKGAILRGGSSHSSPAGSPPLFGLPDVTLTATVDDGEAGGNCGCGQGSGCTCGQGLSPCGCGAAGCDGGGGFRIISDSVHYLVLGQPFVLDLEADGGVSPYAWSAKSGELPDGLALLEEGSIEGIAEAPGSFRVTLEAVDSGGKTASKRFSFIVVENEELAIMTEALPDARVGQFYTSRLRGGGGAKPYSWEIDGLPGWLSFDPDSGILFGTPEESEIHDMTVRLQDRENAVDARLLRLSVYPHDGLLVTSRVLPAAILGEDYSFPLEAMGGIPPYFFALRGGAYLPPGLTLDRTGKLSGKAGEKGVFGFVVDAVDGNNLQGSASYTMAVLDADELSADSQGFTVREYESEKRIRLNFYLPESFSEAEVMAVNALVSPDAYVAGSGSSVTRGQNGEYETGLTLYASESALKGGVSWRELIDSVSLDGIVVRFADASGEEVRFAEAIPVREMKREEGDKGDTGDDGGGCDAGFGAFAFPGTIAFFAAALKTKKKRR